MRSSSRAKGGKVQVLLQRINSHIEFSVSDTGIGIPANFLPHVFDRFSQKDSSTTRSYGGLGLGLAISKQLAELHGGTLEATSPGEGRGSTFIVRLPLTIREAEDPNPPIESIRRIPLSKSRPRFRISLMCMRSSSTTKRMPVISFSE